MFEIVLKVIGNVFAVQQPASLGLPDKALADRTLAWDHRNDGASGLVIDKSPKGLVALD